MTERMTDKRLRQIRDRAGIYGKGTDTNSAMRYVQELLAEVDRLKNPLKVEEGEFEVVPYTEPRVGDIVEIVGARGEYTKWNGIRGKVVRTDTHQVQIRLLKGFERPDGYGRLTEFYWDTDELKIIKVAS